MRIFIDTEFTDFVKCDLISFGAATHNENYFYGENLDFDKQLSSEWVQSNVYPLLDHAKFGMKRYELSARLWSWLDDLPADFVIVMIDYQTDYNLMYDLLGEKHPKILEVQNIYNTFCAAASDRIQTFGGSSTDYEQLVRSLKSNFKLFTMNYFWKTKEKEHHALSDAKANREAFYATAKKFHFYF